MKNKTIYIVLFYLFVSLLFSCKTSDNVVSQHFLTKRKYTKGWYAEFFSKKTLSIPIAKTSTEISFLPKEELKTAIDSNEAEALAFLQSELPTTILGKNKPYYFVTLPPSDYTSKVAKTNTSKKQQEEQPDTKKKKTNLHAIFSVLSLPWAPLAYSVRLYLLSQNAIIVPSLLSLFAYTIYIAILMPLLLGFIAFKKQKAHPKLYKNNGLAMLGIVFGLIWAFAYFAYNLYFFTGFFSRVNLIFVMYMGYYFVPIIIALYVFYSTFFKKEETVKPEPKFEEKELINRKLDKRNRFALILLFFSFSLALALIFFPIFFLRVLPTNMDFYLFLFFCVLIVISLCIKGITFSQKRKLKKGL